jgi:hypothetical protein
MWLEGKGRRNVGGTNADISRSRDLVIGAWSQVAQLLASLYNT